MLGYEVSVKRIIPLHYNAHSRFDATQRTYHYHIHYKENPFLEGLSYFFFSEWDLDKMNDVVALLMQYNDFNPLCKHNPDNKTTLCKLTHARWFHDEEAGRLRFEITANRFLWNMVRMITGLSLMVGRGRLNLDDVKNVMDSGNKFHYIMPVPPQGLYLTKVAYLSFGGFLVCWILVNVYVLTAKPFDPYPFILLNLILSCLAALQAPVIMMSQNRQEAKDRQRSEHDYQVNLKAELEIQQLHEKIDHLILKQGQRLLEIQEVQVELMQQILEQLPKEKP